jgi:hypothetical protein
MRSILRNFAAAVLSASFLVPAAVLAAGVEVLFDPHDRTKTLFPSNLFTVLDFSQNTFRRVHLAKPACTPVIRCDDIDVLNTLDGFNIQPRLSIPFSGPIDVSTVNSESVFLVSLGSTTGRGSIGDKVGINQIVWDPASNTLFAESDELLEQHTRYALIVTSRVRDTAGDPVEGGRFERFRHDLNFGQTKDNLLKEYRNDLLEAAAASRRHGGDRIVAASVFTTLSTTSTLQKIAHQLKAATPAPASFDVAPLSQRAYFPIGTVTGLTWNVQGTTGPTLTPVSLAQGFLALGVRGPVVGALAFGKYASPNYLAADGTIPPVATRTGMPVQQGTTEVQFNIVLPAGPKPAAGYPVAIFGHGFTDHKLGAFLAVAASMAQQGIATIGINVVGHGFGPLGTVTVATTSGPVVVPSGGRGVDLNGNHVFESAEGSSAAAPRSLVGSADALRQTTIDLMQLVREIQVGMDVDGDGAADLDAGRIYYFGQSFGGIYGTIFLGIERDVRVGVPNVPGGPIIDIVRLSPNFRVAILTPSVAARGLINLPSVFLPNGTEIQQFNENSPLRDLPTVINNVAGAIAIQDFFEQSDWATQAGNPVAYAPYLSKSPLPGNPLKSVIIQFAKGDQTVPNPTATAILRAGGLADRATYYRNDLAFALGAGVRNPHTFLTNLGNSPLAGLNALQAQAQIANFFASDGSDTIDPDGAGPIFETPIVPPLPEGLNFLP